MRIGPLPVPEEGAAGGVGVAAVDAFLAHARRREPDLAPTGRDAALVADIARRLDGLPLALELAAGRVGPLTIADLHARLDRALDLFEAGGPDTDARHRTLRDTIDWSFRALPDDEAGLLAAIAVFPGGVDLATAEWLGRRLGLAGDPAALVARLVDASLLAVRRLATPDGEERRYRPLETVRAFALDHLDAAGRRDEADAALVAWAVELTADLRRLGAGPDEAVADARLRHELPNLRRAWDLALGRRRPRRLRHDRPRPRRRHHLPRPARRVRVGPGAGRRPSDGGASPMGGGARGRRRARPGGWATSTGRRRSAAAPWRRRPRPRRRAGARAMQGMTTLFRGDPLVAADLWESVAEETDQDGAIFYAPAALAAQYGGDDDRARALLDPCPRDARTARVAVQPGASPSTPRPRWPPGTDPDRALELYGEAIALARSVGATFVDGVASVGLVRLWGASGRTRAALEGYRTLLPDWRRSGHWTQVWTTLRNLAILLSGAGQPEAATVLLAAADGAPEAAEVQIGVVADELAAVESALVATLGGPQVATLQSRAANLPRGEVVDLAVAAIDAALA